MFRGNFAFDDAFGYSVFVICPSSIEKAIENLSQTFHFFFGHLAAFN